jgi:FkbM family methyltransferase
LLLRLFIQKVRKFGYRVAIMTAGRALLAHGWAFVRRRFLHSYSQFGEDRVIDRTLGRPALGFYVDVGANHPDTLSNTRRFYERGWRGINIEPNSNNCELFRVQRPRDINLNIGVGLESADMTFYRFDPHELSTFSAQAAKQYEHMGYKLIDTSRVAIEPLASVLSKHVPSGGIDFLSVDTEGFDLAVLRSNDWARFRPKLICVEIGDHETRAENADIASYLRTQGYVPVYSNGVNAIWRDGPHANAGI